MRPVKRVFCKRITSIDFILKLLALLSAILIMHLWTTEDDQYYERLPAKSYFEWDLYFHTVIGYIFVLSGQLLLYFLGEIPSLIVQRVVLLYGAALFLISGTVGFINYFWLMKKLQLKMLIIALLCFVSATFMILDHLWQEEYFRPPPEGEVKKTPSKTDTESPSNTTSNTASSVGPASASIE